MLLPPHRSTAARFMTQSKMIKTLGITGGIGSGKTAVCRLLEERGFPVFYADKEAKKLMHEDEGARAAIEAAFGRQSYTDDGQLDRAYLAEQVFGNEEKLEHLNEIVHPRVFEAFEEAKKEAARDGAELLVHEAALIFESGGERHLDAVAVVDAPDEVRLRRVVERDNVTPDQVRDRMGHQLPPDELRRRADYVINNSGAPGELHAEVDRLLQAFEKDHPRVD